MREVSGVVCAGRGGAGWGGAGGRQVVVVKPSETRNLLLGRRRRVECGNTRQVSASGTGDTAHPSMIPSSEHETWNHEGSKFSLRILSSGPPCRSLAAAAAGSLALLNMMNAVCCPVYSLRNGSIF